MVPKHDLGFREVEGVGGGGVGGWGRGWFMGGVA